MHRLIIIAMGVIVGLMFAWAIYPLIATAATVSMHVEWAVNGMPATGDAGFVIYTRPAGTDSWVETARITDPAARSYDGSMTVNQGVNELRMTSYIGDQESDPSDIITYEWIQPATPAGPPVPTVIIQFGAAVTP